MSFTHAPEDSFKIKFSKTGTNASGMWQIVIPDIPSDRKLPMNTELILWNTAPDTFVDGDMVKFEGEPSWKIGARADEYNGEKRWKTQISLTGKLVKVGSAPATAGITVSASDWVSLDEDETGLPF